MAPNFADLYMAYFEAQFVYTHEFQSLVWVRYLDDVFCIFTQGQEKLNDLFSYLNSCNPSIQFTMEASMESVNFLDTTVSIQNGNLKTNLYSKPTDAHNYLLFSSAHPRSCKTSIPYSQFLRIRRICSDIEDYDTNVKLMGTHFLRRGYPLHLVEEAALKVRRIDRQSLLHPPNRAQNPKDDDKLVLVTTYNPDDNTLRDLVTKNWNLLGKSTNTSFLHEKKLMTAYRRPQNLKDILVKANCKIKQPTRGTTTSKQPRISQFLARSLNAQAPIVASSSSADLTTAGKPPTRCNSLGNLTQSITSANICTNKRCRYCPLIDKTGNITSNVSGEVFSCKKNISCKSSNVIYSITCQICNKQYVGQTLRKLAHQFQGHFYNIKIAQETKKSDNAVGMHFSRSDHTGVQDMKIQILDFIKLPPKSVTANTLRLKIEKAWIHKLRCTAPHGLNIFD
jgi:hypothetical protein